MAMIRVTPTISLNDDEVRIDFVRSSGPGGQNVNKLSTAAQLRFDVVQSPSLSASVKRRLIALAGSRMTQAGELVIDARRSRSQTANRDDAIARLVELIARAAVPPKPRRKTKPTRGSRLRRLESKKQRGQAKEQRRRVEPG
ncbi:MAG: alternative ribosome rescue aminoacyl-tRNA hydrolase ArfB [Phycisphaeraceae bacterium]